MTNPDENAEAAAPDGACRTKATAATEAAPKKQTEEDESESMSLGSPAKAAPALPPSGDEVKPEQQDAKTDENLVEFKVVFNKKKYEICFGEEMCFTILYTVNFVDLLYEQPLV